MKKKTQLIHGGIVGDKHTGAVSVPIYQVSTYKQDGVGNFQYEYSRTGNPTREALESLIADLEQGHAGFAFGSGMAAISAVIMLFDSGDHIIFTDDVYGGTYRLMSKVMTRFNIDVTFVDTSKPEAITEAIKENTKAIFVETPTNPLLKITNFNEVSKIANEHNLLFVVDNTFATPYWQNPMIHGAHIVLHSATKYLGGHSDVVAGLVVVNSAELAEKLHFIQNSVGGILGPQDSWLLMRGIKTLGLRMEQTEKTTAKIVEYLSSRDDIQSIYYPGLESHPGHDVHKSQSTGFGGMISFDVGSGERAEKVLRETTYFTLAESLGAVESLISLPAKMTHASIPRDRRLELGITDGLVRISVGIEDAEDLIEDLKQALNQG
ncbi:bifunctional cystathionine gamma-lyase/homocysteine desulfhydrase [Salipaludibacillus agaradhaerens]|uniref:Bifunctional cystathionine gamma-lyase/homocysteine desulfhydrase n=1 Tax=Salipaludibacillus agaradhaerens TaxID=76935 RepID=A0A9Q4G0J9_SALAG|nr:bifunctional cystathionine gamma-lyase/homocysteine desulfhydrase [Salipaludibacillus agaradhaerens]MCR6097968.1 bifunctional cystathionine gamma-lyase/homocysteine desulfhydrase [Salipaludibacillus agaradhaerens]MCR6116403.1 bifunctional cystathionine gamma-lyase/homocysteine desulfhydrase [Salipaludibacillus agaradhaerens]